MAAFVRIVALLAVLAACAPSPQSLGSDLTILIDNNLEGESSALSSSGVILLGHRSYEDAVSGCNALGEQLWSPELETASIQSDLDYLVYEGKVDNSSLFWIASLDGKTRAVGVSGDVVVVDPENDLSVLCTQSAPFSNTTWQDPDQRWQVTVHSNNEYYTGFRDRVSFRFLGIRYAPEPERFTYSVPYEGSGQSLSALDYGSECVQQGLNGSEDCLFLNIWTPYLPRPSSCKPLANDGLKPVMFWIHGGAFTSGTGSDPTFDGGGLASRGDVVVVTINYRLTTLGFLALDDGVTNGNFGFADQINALNWVRAHIQDFGGDPDHITIFGQSAGAGSVRGMMASPKAVGKFVGAITQSNLGGINYGTTYSLYYTIDQEMQVAGDAILEETNCTDAVSQVDCLRAVPATTLANLDTVARYMVVDGTYITSPQLQLDGPRLPFNVLMGVMHHDGAPFITYPTTTNETAYLSSQGFSDPPADLFPIPAGPNATLDLYNMSSRLATDGIFRCIDQATAKRATQTGRLGPIFFYQFGRSYQLIGWPDTNVCEAPPTPAYPAGDPSLPYFKCHSGDLYYVFGNVLRMGLPDRDGKDVWFSRVILDSWAAFARTADPNPDRGFLLARGFQSTLQALESDGDWVPTVAGELRLRVLDVRSYHEPFQELAQCEELGLGLDYYG